MVSSPQTTEFTPTKGDGALLLGVFVLRWTRPELERPYKTWLYPLPPILFLGTTGWTLVYTVAQRPVEALMCAGIIVSGAVFYIATMVLGRKRHSTA